MEKYANGNVYEGDYKKGKPDGKGIYTWNNGEVYDGEWKDALKHGDGIWKGINGDSYIGEWQFSKADGYGVHVWKTGDRYEGEWKACLKHGNGTDLFANGDSYIGQYKFGKPCGYGRYVWKDGSFYVGEFFDGLKCGFGKWRKTTAHRSNTYEGQYYQDKKQGFGIFRWVSGNVYKGQYKDDEREGIGEMRWTDGSVYVGMWSRGIQHGYGRMWFPDGKLKEGLFENNVYKGTWENEIPIPQNYNVMDLAPQGITFSEEVEGYSPIRSPPKTSYVQVRQPPHQKRFMTAGIVPRITKETPLYIAPIVKKTTNLSRYYRSRSKGAATSTKKAKRSVMMNISRNTPGNISYMNSTMHYDSGIKAEYEESPTMPGKRAATKSGYSRLKTAYNSNNLDRSYNASKGGMKAWMSMTKSHHKGDLCKNKK